jgi:hypothetical protein
LKPVVTKLEKSQVETEKLASQVHFKWVNILLSDICFYDVIKL